jgi:hypothetical protein
MLAQICGGMGAPNSGLNWSAPKMGDEKDTNFSRNPFDGGSPKPAPGSARMVRRKRRLGIRSA